MNNTEQCERCQGENMRYKETLEANAKLEPGPVTLHRSRKSFCVWCYDCGHESVDDLQRQRVNSRLFHASEPGRKAEQVRQAAPDLLAACKMAKIIIDDIPDDDPSHNMHEVRDCFATIREAIAKAEGTT